MVEENVNGVQMTFPSETAQSIESFEADEIIESDTEAEPRGFTAEYPDDGEDFSASEGVTEIPFNADELDDAVAAFAALDGNKDSAGKDPFSLPKASGSFPFGAKERPVRQKINIREMLKSLLRGKSVWTNIGPVIVFALLIYCIVFVLAERPYIMLLNGEPIAFVQETANGQKLLEQASLELSAPYPAESNFRQYARISYTRDGVKIKTQITDDQVILDALKTKITWLVDGWTIAVGNESTVYLASKSQAMEVLENVKKSYLPEDDEITVLDMEFVEPVELKVEEIPITDIGSPEQAFRTLTEGREPLREHVVQSGDSYWSIAQKNNMTVDELKLINGATSDRLSIGTVLKLSIPKPLLSVKTTISALGLEEIPYQIIYQSNDGVDQGTRSIISDGAVGARMVEYEIAQINGYSVERKVLAEVIIADPVDKVIESGARTIVASAVSRSESAIAAEIKSGSTGDGGGALSWPLRNKVTSQFGARSRGNHTGIDIQAKTGDPIYSAAPGKVISACAFAAYGNQVTVDHGDGLSTMYAHLSEINVSVGQLIGDQELIGLAGTSGNATGPHLHFEVRINGKPVNPVNYLK